MFSTAKQMFVTVSAGLMIGCCAEIAFAQGSLIPPPGTPAPSMRTLAQVEPRTPISELPFTIAEPGSYYLVSNLTAASTSDGISVETSNVTLDLCGFTLSGPGDDSGHGIYQSSDCNSLRVLNGTVTGFWGADKGGLYLEGANNQIDAVRAIGNVYGIYCDNMSRLSGCTAYANYGDGFYLRRGTLSDCSSNGNQGHGVNGESLAASDCAASENSGFGFLLSGSASLKGCVAKANQGGGISASADSVVSACVVDGNFANGIELLDGASVSGCTVSNNRDNGIQAQSKARITENVCRFNGQRADGAGIYVTGFGNRIEKNHVTDTARGLQITGTGNIVAENTVLDNADNYVFAAGNRLNLLLCEIPETLDWSCSVKLAGTLTCPATEVNGITVNAADVLIDMAGHSLVGPGENSGHGVFQDVTNRNLRINNGKVVNWRGMVKAGVFTRGAGAILADLQASTNYTGFSVGPGSSLSACAANNNSGSGISTSGGCEVSDCVASRNGNIGIEASSRCTISHCSAYGNGNTGILSGSSRVVDCSASDNTFTGIYGGEGSVISGCAATGNDRYGIYILSKSLVCMCTATYNGFFSEQGGAGIMVISSENRIENNLVTNNDKGFDVTASGNLIVRNSASGNTVNWDIVAGNACLVIKATSTTGAINGDSGGVAPGSTDPNANFTH